MLHSWHVQAPEEGSEVETVMALISSRGLQQQQQQQQHL
jgi:hypothetical protein